MKLIRIHNQCTSRYQMFRNTKGVEFITDVENIGQAYNAVQEREDADFFPEEETGKVFSTGGSEVYDPEYPTQFNFGDFSYEVIEEDNLDEWNDAHIIRAIA